MMDSHQKSSRSKCILLTVLFLCSIGVLIIAPFMGAAKISWASVFAQGAQGIDATIFWQMRVPRVLVGFMAGAIFALCGMVFQALFRNPLVSPSTLGVSIGASFGATLYIWLGLSFNILGLSGISLFSFVGAICSIFTVWSLARTKGACSIAKILLAGVAISFLCSSLILFVQYLSDISQSFRITRWLMGGLFVYGYEPVIDMLPFAVVGLVMVFYFTHELNLFTTGEETALSRGVDTDKMIKALFFLVSVLIGGVVSVCGPIAFIGIIVPHICRLMIGADHRYLTLAVFMFGGILLTVCDVLARILAAPAEIPVGVITALLGGPFFLYLLRNKFVE